MDPLTLLVGGALLAAFALLSQGSPSRLDDVVAALAASKGARYSYGGGHPPSPQWWPLGGPGVDGGRGWDCSAYVLAVMLRSASPPPQLVGRDLGTTAIWRAVGSPTNGTRGAVPGQLMFWGLPGKPQHAGFYLGGGYAVSAFGAGRGVNGDDPDQCVKVHRITGVGVPVIGTATW